MKRLFNILLLMLMATGLWAQGYPLIRIFTQNDYKAHNINFDLETDQEGTVYVANFEGLLYYDNVEWRILHTPGLSRVTVVHRDDEGNIWVGGYNYFGLLKRKANGELYMERIGKSDDFKGEIQEIFEKDGVLQFISNDDRIYQVKDGKISVRATVKNTRNIGMTDIVLASVAEERQEAKVLTHYTQEIDLEEGMTAAVLKGDGIVIRNASGHELYHINKDHGLPNNNVVWISYNGHGIIWGASDDAIFAISFPSAFSRFSANEGLSGAVHAITNFGGTMYVGTANGLFQMKGLAFEQVGDIHHACWKLVTSIYGLMAATANGVYLITPSGSVTQLSQGSTTAIIEDSGDYLAAEFDGLYRLPLAGKSRIRVFDGEKVNKVLYDPQGTIWLQSIYGEVWRKRPSEKTYKRVTKGDADNDEIATIVPLHDKVEVINSEDEQPFPYPLFSCLDQRDITWLTNSEGKNLHRWKDGKRLGDMRDLIKPFRNTVVRALYFEDDKIWIGSDNGLWIVDRKTKDPLIDTKPQLKFRSITLGNDSVLWGGFGKMPTSIPTLNSQESTLRFTYAVDYPLLVGQTSYRYKLNDGRWSPWDADSDAEFTSLPYGSYTITVECRLATGEEVEPITMSFNIAYPFYLRWYMMILYVILAALLIYAFLRYRLSRLQRDKIQLENIVQERTAEVVKQKDEIEMKSKSLETALNELHTAQNELIRQEKMATVGKLTQGLIDRILNPLNYINNFSKLSEGLVKDIEANIEDDKDNMAPENYEDTREVLDMLHSNLVKVGEHGQNTTRTLKAMEEMLKDRSGGIVRMDLAKLLHQIQEMVNTYFANNIAKHHIKVVFSMPDGELPIEGNAEQLGKALMSMLANGIYALEKKAQREQFQPEMSLIVSNTGNQLTLTIRDNGIGMENTIINKIFDPFFTTKTTGEASGVGLYLTREIIQNHGGDIQVKSEKNEYSEFTITLPALKQ